MTADSKLTPLAAPLRRRPEPLTASVDGEIVMLDAERGAYFALGEVGSRIWELLEEPCTFDELCCALQGEYEVDPGTCREQVARFVEDLREAQLIEAAA